MSKHVLVFAAIASALLLFSCQKEIVDPGKDDPKKPDDPKSLVFSASIEGAYSKTSLTIEDNKGKVSWVGSPNPDEITINGVVYTASPRSGDDTSADFTKKDTTEDDPDSPYYAFFPKEIQSDENMGTLPAEQTYTAGSISNLPMYAESETTQLKFKNICSVLKVTVKSSDMATVKSIRVSSSNKALSGFFYIASYDEQSATAVLDSPEDISQYVTLNCGSSGVPTAAEGTDFYIAIPAYSDEDAYKDLKIELSSNGTSYSKSMTTKDSKAITTAVNTIYPITFKADTPRDVLLSGEFSVSDYKTVKFTSGNLWWNGNDWKVESSQTKYPTGWTPIHVGHLFWSKTASVAYAGEYSDSEIYEYDKFFCGEDNKLTVDGQGDLYALSRDEWCYLLNVDRSTGEQKTDENNRKGKYKYPVTVGSTINCLIIAPDGYSGTIADSYDAPAWAAAESAGLVCLPPAGVRDGTDLSSQGGYGHYWSSTPCEDPEFVYYSYPLTFYSYGGNNYVDPVNTDSRSNGSAIRLVKTESEVILPDYPGGGGKGIKIGNTIWAPVNCGYDATHPCGLLYQWGRQYGQAYESGTLTPTIMSKDDDTEANKGIFGEFNSSTHNWFSGAVDDTLWNSTKRGTKDPCPAGWRVPTKDELSRLIANKSGWTSKGDHNGYYFSGSITYSESVPRVFFPAAGWRDCASGDASGRGDGGDYWSSSVDGNGACYLDFNEDEADLFSGSRAFGSSVRCVKE